jgi:hypothetical protein
MLRKRHRSQNSKIKPPTPQPARWYGLVALPADYVWRGVAYAVRVLDEIYANPEVILWSRNPAEVVERSHRRDLCDRVALFIEVDYDPTRFTIQREFRPDVDAQLKGLRAVLHVEGGPA